MKPYYDDGKGIVIYHGDCREILPTLPKVDLVLTDPPYAIPTVIAQGRSTHRNVGDLSICERYFRDWFSDLQCCLRSTGRAFIFCNQTSYPVLFRSLYSFCEVGLLVWDKGRIGMGGDYRKTFELIAYVRLNDAEPVEKDGIGYGDILRVPSVPSASRLHPAEKPIRLLNQILKRFYGLILDPFMGSGTTLRAAKDLGRKAIGIEIEERYCEIAAKRLAQEVLPLECKA